MLDTEAELIDELEHWLDLMRQAARLHDRMPPELIRHIEAGAGPEEMVRLAVLTASVSTQTRQSIERTLSSAIAMLSETVTPSDQGVLSSCGRLRLVSSPQRER
jgi:hypothetical protein